ncbi:hypothetical protein FACS1894196_4610 [Clostridia bacterium]|nr:hypothetical protein FACS1894196_4610 [Clostridia bacterium]
MNEYGARVERGRVTEVTADGTRVESLEREGITTPPIAVAQWVTVAEGDRVYFFVFDDGGGMIFETF